MNGGQLRLSQVWPFQLQNICLLRCPRATRVWRGGGVLSLARRCFMDRLPLSLPPWTPALHGPFRSTLLTGSPLLRGGGGGGGV